MQLITLLNKLANGTHVVIHYSNAFITSQTYTKGTKYAVVMFEHAKVENFGIQDNKLIVFANCGK